MKHIINNKELRECVGGPTGGGTGGGGGPGRGGGGGGGGGDDGSVLSLVSALDPKILSNDHVSDILSDIFIPPFTP